MNTTKRTETIKGLVQQETGDTFAPEYKDRGHAPLTAEDRAFIKLHDEYLGTFVQIAEYNGWLKNRKPNRNIAASLWNQITDKGHTFLGKKERDTLRSWRQYFTSKKLVDAYFAQRRDSIDETARDLYKRGYRFHALPSDFPNARAPKELKLLEMKPVQTVTPIPTVKPATQEEPVPEVKTPETIADHVPEPTNLSVTAQSFAETVDAVVATAMQDEVSDDEGGPLPGTDETEDDPNKEPEHSQSGDQPEPRRDIPAPTKNIDGLLRHLGPEQERWERTTPLPPRAERKDEPKAVEGVSMGLRQAAAELFSDARKRSGESIEGMANRAMRVRYAADKKTKPLPKETWEKIDRHEIGDAAILKQAIEDFCKAEDIDLSFGRGRWAGVIIRKLAAFNKG